jgi:hypothetical protein
VEFEQGMRPLEEVRNWTREMTRQIRESLGGEGKLEMPKWKLSVLLVEFKKVWEGVWKAYLSDRRNRDFI